MSTNEQPSFDGTIAGRSIDAGSSTYFPAA